MLTWSSSPKRFPIDKNSKIYVAGNTGMVGSAIARNLKKRGYNNLIFSPRSQVDLRNQDSVKSFFKDQRPDYVFLAAAKVGGILVNNKFRADFIYDNMMIQNNIIHYAYKFHVKKLLFLGSSCIYPKDCSQPMKEEYLLTNKLEPTNEPYAIAKISGIKLCESYNRQYGTEFLSIMPTNLYGEGDNFNLKSSHVLPALIRKIYEAFTNDQPVVDIWGTGEVSREFLHVDDCAEASIFVLQNLNYQYFESEKISHINIGSGKEVTILNLANLISEIIGFKGNFHFDITKPDGMKRKLLNCDRINALGWESKISLQAGLEKTIRYFSRLNRDK